MIIEEIVWLKENATYSKIYTASTYLSLGILTVFHVFYPVSGKLMRSETCHPMEAETAIIKFKQSKVSPAEYYISAVNHYKNEIDNVASFEIDGQRYACCNSDDWKEFIVPDVAPGFERFATARPAYGKSKRDRERDLYKAIYGPNRMLIPIPDVYEICIKHAFHPILVFGYFACALWFYQAYYWYGAVLLFGILAALNFMTRATIENLESLKLMVGRNSTVKLIDPYSNPGDISKMISEGYSVADNELIIGDHFVVSEDMLLPCDAVLVSGRVVMNESMLTGESIPVSKVAYVPTRPSQSSAYDDSDNTTPMLRATAAAFTVDPARDEFIELADKRPGSVLFAGTKVKHVIGDAVCVCYKTGFRSAKGQLICSLLHPKQNFLNFFEDVIYVVLFMFVLATVLFGYQAYYLYVNGYSNTYIVVLYFDALTDAIPIGLIICLVISTTIALRRLKWMNMFVSESARVNMAGITSIACFDKTGTLTDEHLKFHSAIYMETIQKGTTRTECTESVYTPTDSLSNLPRICGEIMACCHDLSMSSGSSVPQGDLLEAELFRVSGWRMGNPFSESSISNQRELAAYAPVNSNNNYPDANNDNKHTILKTFEFSPETARSSAFIRRPNNELVYLLKGSPESIIAISDKTTVPTDIEQKLARYAKNGLRVLAFAYRSCDDRDIKEFMSYSFKQFEHLDGIVFGGLLCLVSNLKPDTKRTIETLLNANIHVNMITGDHVHTAIAVAVDCGIIPKATSAAGSGHNQAIVTSNASDVEAVSGADEAQNIYHFIVDVNAEGEIVIIDTIDDSILSISLLELLRYADAARSHLLKKASNSIVDQLFQETHELLAALHHRQNQHTHSVDKYHPTSSDPSSLWYSRPVGLFCLAVTGKALQTIRQTLPAYLLHSVVRYAAVFARAKPNDKKFVVELLMVSPSYSKVTFDELTEQEQRSDAEAMNKTLDAAVTIYNEEDCVLFCGDGANDMAALRACTVGLSLCDVETSIAAPVTSREPTPYATVQLILEGRWSICTAYALASFELYYGMITTFLYVVLFGYGIMETDAQFTVIGCFQIIVSIAILILREPSTPLSYELPPKRYFSRQILVFLVPQFVLIPLFQMLALYVLSIQSFYVEFETDDPLTSGYAYEATVLVLMAMAQTMISAAVSCIGSPFTQDWYDNVWFWLANVPTLAWLLYSTFAGNSYFAESDLDMEPIPTYFGFIMCGLYVANAFAAGLCLLMSKYLLYQPRVRRILPVVLEEKTKSASASVSI